jgi:DNA adenine methylase
VEPFAGGGTASLVAVLEGYAERSVLIERDPCVAAVWKTILSTDAEWLAEKILKFRFSIRNVKQLLRTRPRSIRLIAFQTIVKNRARRGGILSDNANLIKKGERGRGIKSRWYPDTLALRIALIHTHRKQLTFIHGDGINGITNFSKQRINVRFFVDPPYPENDSPRGNRLYTYNKLDHENLFALLDSTNRDFLLTYNDSRRVRALSERYKFSTTLINMTSTHGLPRYELLIRPGRWFRQQG